MVYRKRAARKAPRYGKKRHVMKRRPRRTLPRNQITSAVFRFAMPIIENKVNAGSGDANADHIAPSVSDMPGSNPYKELFAQYRVCKIKVEFIPQVSRNVITGDNTTENDFERPMFATSINRLATSFPTRS